MKPNWNVIRFDSKYFVYLFNFAIVQTFLLLLIFHLLVIYVPLRNSRLRSQVYFGSLESEKNIVQIHYGTELAVKLEHDDDAVKILSLVIIPKQRSLRFQGT